MKDPKGIDPFALFGAYMRLTGVASLEAEASGDAALRGRALGILNGSSWISLWATWFGRTLLPGVKLVGVGNEGIQLHFMAAHRGGDPVPPRRNVELFRRYARDLLELYPLDALLLTCSTMNRAYPEVREAVKAFGVPVVQIDEPMMEKAVGLGPRILVVATHGPTVRSTEALLAETAGRMGRDVRVEGATVEEAFRLLGEGDIEGHNDRIARVIRSAVARASFDAVVLAQLSMSVFAFSYPDRVAAFGVPVLTSGEEGFLRMREILEAAPPRA